MKPMEIVEFARNNEYDKVTELAKKHPTHASPVLFLFPNLTV